MRCSTYSQGTACGLLALILALPGCGGDGKTTKPDLPGPWDYPTSSKFAITLYSDQATYAIGDSFDLKVVFYNLTEVFGVALEINYHPELVGAGRILENSGILTAQNPSVSIGRIEPDSSKVSCGFALLRGAGTVPVNNGVILKVRCKALETGTAEFSFRATTLTIVQDNGEPIPDFANLQKEGLSLTIR